MCKRAFYVHQFKTALLWSISCSLTSTNTANSWAFMISRLQLHLIFKTIRLTSDIRIFHQYGSGRLKSKLVSQVKPLVWIKRFHKKKNNSCTHENHFDDKTFPLNRTSPPSFNLESPTIIRIRCFRYFSSQTVISFRPKNWYKVFVTWNIRAVSSYININNRFYHGPIE